MERALPRSFEPSHYHIIGHTRGTFGEENTITHAAKVFLVVKTLKIGKAAGFNEIRPEMFKALNGVLWLIRVCHLAWCSGRTEKDWLIEVIVLSQEELQKVMQQLLMYLSP